MRCFSPGGLVILWRDDQRFRLHSRPQRSSGVTQKTWASYDADYKDGTIEGIFIAMLQRELMDEYEIGNSSLLIGTATLRKETTRLATTPIGNSSASGISHAVVGRVMSLCLSVHQFAAISTRVAAPLSRPAVSCSIPS